MDVYVFQAALLCADCGQIMQAELLSQGLPRDEDSGRYPQGPYSDGGGEADCPQHCDHCHLFLENPLTADGYAYVADAIEEGRGAAIEQWRAYYGDPTPADKGAM